VVYAFLGWGLSTLCPRGGAILPSPLRFYQEQYLKEKARETRIDWILSNMGDGGKLSAGEVKKWSQAPLRFVPPPKH
jgi:membrane peptidoglycan carboxypeptidase